jgi:hypothetical protein
MVADYADACRVWRPWADVAELFDGSGDPVWTAGAPAADFLCLATCAASRPP